MLVKWHCVNYCSSNGFAILRTYPHNYSYMYYTIDFNACDSVTLDALHQTYCRHMYGCELWNLNCIYYVTKFVTAWRKIKRCIRNRPYTTHNNIAYNLSVIFVFN